MMDFVLKMMDFASKMMDFVLKMMDFASKMMDFNGNGQAGEVFFKVTNLDSENNLTLTVIYYK